MAPKKKGGKKKKVVQESAAVLWLTESDGFGKTDLLSLMDQFKKISADVKVTVEGKGKKKKVTEECSVDGGGDDNISQEEFTKYFSKTMGMSVSDSAMLFKAADVSGDGMISFKEFCTLMAMLQKGSPADRLEMTFRAFDEDKSGYLDPDEIRAMLSNVLEYGGDGGDMDELVEECFMLIDTSGDGKISLEECLAALEKSPETAEKFFGQKFVEPHDLI